jgi:hypothetical protein
MTEDEELDAKRWAHWRAVSLPLEDVPSPAGSQGTQYFWRLRVLWDTRGPTAKQAALLRQFVPEFSGRSIAEVSEWLAGASSREWRMLDTEAARRLRQEAEARGFRAEAVQEGLDDPAIASVRSLMQAHRDSHPEAARYGISFHPSFHEAGYILVTLGPGASQAAARSGHTPLPPA